MHEMRSNCGDRLHDYVKSGPRQREWLVWKSTKMGIERKIYLRKQGQTKILPESIGPRSRKGRSRRSIKAKRRFCLNQ
jgi:hypothetical protein